MSSAFPPELRISAITIDGEVVVANRDGRSDFDKLHSRGYDEYAFLYGFDLLELNGDDLRREPLEQRKHRLERYSRAL